MLRKVGEFTVRRRWLVLVASVVTLLAAGAFGGNVAQHLSSGGFSDPNAESTRAQDQLRDVFHTGTPNFLLLLTAKTGSVDDPSVARQGVAITQQLAREPGMQAVVSYWTLGSPPPLRSRNARQALILAQIRGDDDQVRDRVEVLSPKYTRQDGPVTVGVGGRAEIFRQVGTQVEKDLRKAEGLSIPITLILLILVFGSVIAAGLPLGIGVLAIIGTFFVLRVIASFTQVSIFSLNLTTGMGLGLSIDYSLFIVSRFREEMRRGLEPNEAVVRSLQTAGRTVAFSAVTVAISLSALLIFPLAFLRSFAYAGIAVVGVAAAGALIFLPAVLALLGRRVDKWALWRRKPKEVGEGFWHRLAMLVMRRPVIVGVTVIALLLVLGSPFLRANFGLPDDRVEPKEATSRVVQDAIRHNFTSQEMATAPVVATGLANAPARAAEIAQYATSLSRVRGVARVDALTGSYAGGRQVVPPNQFSARFVAPTGTWFSAVPAVEPISDEGEAVVKAIRNQPAPFDVLVGGPAAELVDSKATLVRLLPIAGIIIGVVTFVVLFLFAGGLLVPVKAIILNLFSLSATFGAMVWIFQEGHLSGPLGFTATGLIDTTTPILMFCLAFGLSMDYEVFLLSRIKEEHDRTGDNTSAVAIGLERTGRIVTAAAALLAVVFAAFATSEITFIKLFGVGMALAVLMDATLIRGTLVPAFMRLAGQANWWAPKFLRRFHDRFGLAEAEEVPLPEPRVEAVAVSGDGQAAETPAGEPSIREPQRG